MSHGSVSFVQSKAKWKKANLEKYKANDIVYRKRNRKKINKQSSDRYHYTRSRVLQAINTSDPESLFYEEP